MTKTNARKALRQIQKLLGTREVVVFFTEADNDNRYSVMGHKQDVHIVAKALMSRLLVSGELRLDKDQKIRD